MVKTRSMVVEERIVSEVQRLLLKYFSNLFLEMAILTPVPPTYQGLSGEEAVVDEEDFYYKWRFYVFVLTGEERWASLRTLAERQGILRLSPLHLYQLYGGGGYRRGGGGSGGGGGKLIEGLDIRSRELEYAHYFYESFFRVFLRNLSEREMVVGLIAEVEIDFEYMRIGRTCDDNIIWVKGNYLQRDDEELLDLRFRFVKQSVKSIVERKESLLDEVAEEETELELFLGELGLSRKMGVESRSKKVGKVQSTRSMESVDEGTRQTSGDEVRAKTPGSGNSAQANLTTSKIAHKFLKRRIKMVLPTSSTTVSSEVAQGKRIKVTRLVKGIWLGIEEQESELKKAKSKLKINLARAKTDTLKEVKQLKVAYAVVIGQLQVEAKTNLDETAEERDRQSYHLMLKGYSQEEVELDASRVREDHAFISNREFVKQFDRMKEANENREDQYVKVYFRLEKLNQVVSDLTRQVEEKDFRIKKGLEDLFEAIEHAENLQRLVDALAVKDARLKAERDHAIVRAKKAEAGEHSGESRTVIKRGNEDLRECQHKLDVALIREKILEGELRAKDSLVRRKDEPLKDQPAREEFNAELGILRAQDTYASIKVRHERLKARFAKAVPDVARSDLLKVIIAYFVEEVKRLDSE
ncbi:hypothetical protein GIB67_015128 [Kingdonia uniflora]|uniref:Uncharacterized protein n=1 Tax=Kingdonia uniflora TaxID=39325 RepID=A0A7J7LJC5_9MAGN|nr:hypothetical protein GIB67_015128 [Kingdonia uniflora]